MSRRFQTVRIPATYAGAYWTRIRQPRPQTLLAVLLVLFVALALQAHSVRLLHLDEQITWAVQRFRQPWLDRVVESVTLCGNTLSLLALGFGIAFYLYQSARAWDAWRCLFALLGLPANELIKWIVHRHRPQPGVVQVLLHATGFSFPSGHAMGSALFYGFIAFLLWMRTPATLWNRARAVGLMLLIVSIGLSRIYLGVHWFSDVLAGWLAGLFLLVLLAHLP